MICYLATLRTDKMQWDIIGVKSYQGLQRMKVSANAQGHAGYEIIRKEIIRGGEITVISETD